MNRKNIFAIAAHVLFCLLLAYWFYSNSVIRPLAINNQYKELVSALLLLFTVYLNYLVFIPSILSKSYYKRYIFLSLLLIVTASLIELLLVKSDILICFKHIDPLYFDINKHLRSILFMIFLRNIGFYLFFTVLKLYQQSRENAIMDKKAVLKDTGVVVFIPRRGDRVPLDIKRISYFSHKKNITSIHSPTRQEIPIYATLTDIENYLGEHCLRISKMNIITFTNIISYNEKSVTVKSRNPDKIEY